MNGKIAQIKKCLICRVSIKAYGDMGRRKNKQFCSRKCRGVYQTKQGVINKKCLLCLKQFKISGSQKILGYGKFCSMLCYGISKRSENYNPSLDLKIRKSWKYAQWRKAIYQRDNYTCQECGKRGGRLEADHIKPFAQFLELRFELSNGRTLCKECHIKTPTYGGRNYSFYQVSRVFS